MECFIVSEANPNLALDVQGGSRDHGANVIIWDFHGQDNQKWIIRGNEITSVNSGKVMDIQGGEKKGAKIIQWEANNGPNQKWYFHQDGTIRSQNGLCLDICGGKIQKGTNIIAWENNNGINQKWRLVTRK